MSGNNIRVLPDPPSNRSDNMLIFHSYDMASFKYLTKNTFCEVQTLIRKMGSIIGWKNCILLIDTFLAELYDMFLDRTRLFGKCHGDWIISKCGIMLTVNEVSVDSTCILVETHNIVTHLSYSYFTVLIRTFRRMHIYHRH